MRSDIQSPSPKRPASCNPGCKINMALHVLVATLTVPTADRHERAQPARDKFHTEKPTPQRISVIIEMGCSKNEGIRPLMLLRNDSS